MLDAQIAADDGRFDIVDVIELLTQKMIARHPHVFGDAQPPPPPTSNALGTRRTGREAAESVLDGIPADLPALARAARITKCAARVGYDFPHRDMLFDKLREELAELQHELYPDGQTRDRRRRRGPADPDEPIADADRLSRVEGELGDVLFVIANIARRWGINPEEALRCEPQVQYPVPGHRARCRRRRPHDGTGHACRDGEHYQRAKLAEGSE